MSKHRNGWIAKQDARDLPIKQQLIRLCGTRCMYCETDVGRKITWHHILPRSCGGPNTLSNSSLLCEECQKKIHSYLVNSEEFQDMTRKIIANKKQWMRK
jgi:5-methylcytosine-specific restriction endonuclease McrA